MPCIHNPATGQVETTHERYTREFETEQRMMADRYGAAYMRRHGIILEVARRVLLTPSKRRAS